jgi:hypothetical protein
MATAIESRRRGRFARPRRLVALYTVAVITGGGGTAGCAERPTADRLRAEIAAYEADPSEAREAEIEASFAELDAQVKRLEAKAARSEGSARESATAEAERLGKTRDELHDEWNDARVDHAVGAAKDAVKSVGSSIGNAFKEAGRQIEGAFGRGETPAP